MWSGVRRRTDVGGSEIKNKRTREVDTEEIEEYPNLSGLTRRKLKTERHSGRWIYCSLKVGRTVDPWLTGQNMAQTWPNYMPATYVIAVILSF